MEINKLSKRALRLLYYAIRDALNEDDQLPEGKKKYGVREFPDFHEFSVALEKVMDEKDISYIFHVSNHLKYTI